MTTSSINLLPPESDHRISLRFPEELEGIVDVTSRAWGIGDTATRLLMLNTVAAAIGNSMRIRTPDLREYIPAINLGVVAGEEAIPHGAAMYCMSPVFEIMRMAVEMRQARGVQLTRASLEDLVRQRRHLESEINRETRELEELGPAPAQTPEEQAAIAEDVFAAATGKPPGPHVRRVKLTESLELNKESLEAVRDETARIRLETGPYVLRKDQDFGEFAKTSRKSFDGSCGHLVFCFRVFGSLAHLPKRHLEAYAACLQRTATGSQAPGLESTDLLPGAWSVVCGETDDWSKVFSRAAIAEVGLFHDFVICEAGASDLECDLNAMRQAGELLAFREFINRTFIDQRGTSSTALVFGVAGAGHFLELRRWCRQFVATLPEEIRPYFANWPAITARIALALGILHKDHDGVTIPDSYVAAACTFARQYAPIQAALLTKLHAADSDETLREMRLRRLVQKLRVKGPLTLRGVVRTYDRQNYTEIEGLLELAIVRGLISRQGPLFLAESGSGSAVSGTNILNITGGVPT